MFKDTYDRTIVINDLDPYFFLLIEWDKYHMSVRNPEIPYELNVFYMLKERLREALGLDYSNFYFDLQKDAIIYENSLILTFKNIPSDKVDIKPSKFKKKVRGALKGIGKELEIKTYTPWYKRFFGFIKKKISHNRTYS